MLEFKKTGIEDLIIIRDFYSKFKEFSCENTILNIVVWQNHFNFEYCLYNDMLFSKVKYGNNTVFAIPAANDIKSAMALLEEYCNKNNLPLIFTAAEGENFNSFKENFADKFSFQENRDAFEYIYSYDSLAFLSGKKYHGKRNHISSFKKKYNYIYESLNEENLHEAFLMTEKWYEENKERSDRFISIERNGAKKIFDNFNALGAKGGLLRVDNNIVAVTFGCAVNSDVFDVCFEKALTEYDGAYTMINNQFVLNELKDFKYINREDDMGLEGLRKAKLSYKPEILLKKYLIREI